MTGSYSASETFSLTNAKYLASKVVSDLYQSSNFYGEPSAASIAKYHEELVVMLAGGYIREYEFGFKKDGRRIVSWQYRVSASGDLVGGSDQRSGGIFARADITGASSPRSRTPRRVVGLSPRKRSTQSRFPSSFSPRQE